MEFIASIRKKIKKKSKTLHFQTTLQCGGCLQKVRPYLDNMDGVYDWKVKLDHVDKLLKVKADPDKVDEVVDAVQKAFEQEGYAAKLFK